MSEKQYPKELFEDGKNEVWAHKTSGEIVIVYERGETYARFQENYNYDMLLQGHQQMGDNFYNTYKFIGSFKL